MITRDSAARAVQTATRVARGYVASIKPRLRRGVDRVNAWTHGLRKLWLFLIEVIGVVLVTWGISFWSIPSAVIIGGLVLVAVVEIRPMQGPKFPVIPVPELALRTQALFAAEAINNERFGLSMVDPTAFEKLTTDDCEKIITLAKTVGARRT